MSKALKTQNLAGRNATRSLLAVSLSMSLFAFGCTTDRTLGNGDPVTTPGLRTSPSSSPGTGSESTPALPPSMTSSSSYQQEQALPTVTARRSSVRVSADQAAAIMAQYQPRVRYLGPAYPGGQQSGLGQSATGFQTGQFQNPAMQLNPRSTINSSITSAPTPAITSGAGGDAGGGLSGAIVEGAFIGGTAVNGGGTNAGLTAAGTAGANSLAPRTSVNANSGAAPVIAPTTAAGLSPLGASPGAALPLGSTGFGVTPTTAPTAFTARNPDPTVSSFPALAVQNTNTRTGVGATNGAVLGTGSNGTNTNRANAVGTRAGANANAIGNRNAATSGTGSATSGGVVATRDGNGRIVITNTNDNQ